MTKLDPVLDNAQGRLSHTDKFFQLQSTQFQQDAGFTKLLIWFGGLLQEDKDFITERKLLELRGIHHNLLRGKNDSIDIL